MRVRIDSENRTPETSRAGSPGSPRRGPAAARSEIAVGKQPRSLHSRRIDPQRRRQRRVEAPESGRAEAADVAGRLRLRGHSRGRVVEGDGHARFELLQHLGGRRFSGSGDGDRVSERRRLRAEYGHVHGGRSRRGVVRPAPVAGSVGLRGRDRIRAEDDGAANDGSSHRPRPAFSGCRGSARGPGFVRGPGWSGRRRVTAGRRRRRVSCGDRRREEDHHSGGFGRDDDARRSACRADFIGAGFGCGGSVPGRRRLPGREPDRIRCRTPVQADGRVGTGHEVVRGRAGAVR